VTRDVTGAVQASDYPHLFGDAHWGALRCRFELCDSAPVATETSNVNIVPYVGNTWLMMRLASGEWDVPGGTLEPGEGVLDTLRRELMEEAGAKLIGFHPFGFWRCHSSAAAAYRPHLPHPDSYRLVGYGEVTVVGKPLNPEGAEQVVEVVCTSLDEVCQRFLSAGRDDLADLYRLAARVRSLAGSVWQVCR